MSSQARLKNALSGGVAFFLLYPCIFQTPFCSMPEKNKSLLLTLGAAGLLIGGGVTAYWVLSQQTLSGDMPVGANIIPQDALLTVSVSTDSEQWQQLRQFGTKNTQAQLNKNLAQLRDYFLTANGYNYQKNIQPWVGEEVTIAFLPPQNTPTKKSPAADKQQSLVMVLPIENAAAAKQALDNRLKQGKWTNRNYQGVQIKETQGLPTQNYSTAVLDQLLVVTDNPKATERAIDTYKGGASIIKTPGYTQALRKIKAPHFAQVYVNIPAAARVAAINPARAFSPQRLQLQNYQGLASTVSLESEGIRFKSISWLKQDSPDIPAVAAGMQNRLPAETLMMISGANLQQLWQDYAQGAKSNPLAPLPPENLRGGVKSLTGLDLEQDLLKWMGEFSLAVIPAAPKGVDSEDFALSLLLMVETRDRALAEKALQQIDRVISRQYQFQIQKTQVAGKPVVNWISPFGTLTATHGWLDQDVAFLTLGAPIASRLLPNPTTTLASTQQFQKTLSSELKPTNGQFFLNVTPTIQALPLPQFFPNQQIFLEAIRSIGLTSAKSDQRSTRYDIVVLLKKVGAPSNIDQPILGTPQPTASP